MNTTYLKKEAAVTGHIMRAPAAAAYLQLSTSTLAKWRLRGCGPPFSKLGRAVVYSTNDLDEFLASRRRFSTSDSGDAS